MLKLQDRRFARIRPLAARVGRRCVLVLVAAVMMLATGCFRVPVLLSENDQRPIDRSIVEYPPGFELRPYVRNLHAPTAIAFDQDGTLLIAEGGIARDEPHIFGFRPDGTKVDIYPTSRNIPFIGRGFTIYGPIGGMVVDQGRIFVSHRDANGMGAITAFGYDGSHKTIVADLPAAGDYSVTDLAIGPDGRLYFGVGAATNSGVVGHDNWAIGWVRKHPKFSDTPARDIKLLGYRFDTKNPRASLFGGDDIAVTAPFQAFGKSTQTWVRVPRDVKPTAALYSCDPNGGGWKVEAWGIRHPRGLEFNKFGTLYFTNNGMELRGTRPVKDDPDVLLRFISGAWYGWPDYSADLYPISNERFQWPSELVVRTGYPDLSNLIDHEASNLIRPDRSTLVRTTFPALSGAAKFAFAPGAGPFKQFEGNAIIALSGDRAPFATSGLKLKAPVGYKVVMYDDPSRQLTDFVRNTKGVPASMLGRRVEALERPIDVKFGPDGAMYILDFGRLEVRDGKERVGKQTGRIFKLVGVHAPAPTTAPAR